MLIRGFALSLNNGVVEVDGSSNHPPGSKEEFLWGKVSIQSA
jgi:hypothetical protein